MAGSPLFVVVVFCLLLHGLPCLSSAGYLSFSCPGPGSQFWGDEAKYNQQDVSTFGTGGSTCYANKVKGVVSVTRFSYFFFIDNSDGTAPTCNAAVIDTSTYTAVATTPITLPVGRASLTATNVTASFSAGQNLDVTTEYLLAFCCDTSTGSTTYELATDASGSNAEAFYYCNSNDCTTTSASWQQNSLTYTLITDITYICASPSPSPSPTISVTPSTTPSPSSSVTPGVSRTSTPTTSPTNSPSPSSSPPPSVSPSPSPSVSSSPIAPSASPSPLVLPITANVRATFDGKQPLVNISAPASALLQGGAALKSQLHQVQAGSSSVSGVEWAVTNTSSTSGYGNNTGSVATHVYSAQLGNWTTFQHSYTFYNQSSQGDFSGLAFNIAAGSVKWSIDLFPSSTVSGGSAGSNGITLSYLLSNLAPSSASGAEVKEVRNSPLANMTTYYLPLSSSAGVVVAQLELFDVALVDGVFDFINHSIVIVDSDEGQAAYELVLQFPSFTQSLSYDPSLGLGVLLGSDKSGGGSSNTGLIVAVAVVVPIAVLVVVAVAVIGTTVIYLRKRRQQAQMGQQMRNRQDTDLL